MPIKRSEYLKAISREHHHGLLLCWKIKTGIQKQIEVERIWKYAYWFFNNHLQDHFAIEEKYIFPVLGDQHKGVQRAKAEHKIIAQLFANKKDKMETLQQINLLLKDHIRFEERVLFNEIEEVATEEQIKQINKHHHHNKFIDNEEDAFWETKKK